MYTVSPRMSLTVSLGQQKQPRVSEHFHAACHEEMGPVGWKCLDLGNPVLKFGSVPPSVVPQYPCNRMSMVILSNKIV